MDKWIEITEYNWAFWVAGLFALLDFGKWAWSLIEHYIIKFGIETKNMRLKREYAERLKKTEQAIEDIKETSKANVSMFVEHEKKVVEYFSGMKSEVVKQLEELSNKFDEQQEQIENQLNDIDKDGKARDRAVIRDRIIQSCRYYSQRRDEDGKIHVSISEHENLRHLFEEYFAANGNGSVKSIYDNDFLKNYVIDTLLSDFK